MCVLVQNNTKLYALKLMKQIKFWLLFQGVPTISKPFILYRMKSTYNNSWECLWLYKVYTDLGTLRNMHIPNRKIVIYSYSKQKD